MHTIYFYHEKTEMRFWKQVLLSNVLKDNMGNYNLYLSLYILDNVYVTFNPRNRSFTSNKVGKNNH